MILLESAAADTTTGDDLCHWCCCQDDTIAYCGADVTDEPWIEFDVATCAVCDILANGTPAYICPVDGRECPGEVAG